MHKFCTQELAVKYSKNSNNESSIKLLGFIMSIGIAFTTVSTYASYSKTYYSKVRAERAVKQKINNLSVNTHYKSSKSHDASYYNMKSNENSIYIGAGIGSYFSRNFRDIESVYVKDSLNTNSFNTLSYNLLVGYRYNNYLRFDINGQYRNLKYSTSEESSAGTISYNQKIDNYSLFLNGSIDFDHSNSEAPLFPYITAGIGYSRNKNGALRSDASKMPSMSFSAPGISTNNFAWNLGAGVNFRITQDTYIDLNYKYFDLGKIRTEATKDQMGMIVPSASQNLRVHQVGVNLIHYF